MASTATMDDYMKDGVVGESVAGPTEKCGMQRVNSRSSATQDTGEAPVPHELRRLPLYFFFVG
jgi:hypothetical protein